MVAAVGLPDRLRTVTDQLTASLTLLEQDLARDVNKSMVFLRLLHARVEFVNETLTLALENYHDFPLTHRSKRGLFDGIGKLSRMIFGTAMNEDVEELRDRYNHLVSLASAHNKAINLNSRNIAKLEQQMHDVASYTATLRSSLNKMLTSIKHIYEMTTIGQALPALENPVTSLLRSNSLIIRNVVDATRGRVTDSLFPVKDLLKILEIGEAEYKLTPLFDDKSVHYYYPLLESFLTSDAIVIHVPFRSTEEFEAYRLEPFPFSVNGIILELDTPSSVVLVRSDFSLYATGPFSDLQYQHLFFCSASLFAFLPVTGAICEVVLTQIDASKALEICPYRHVLSKSLFHRRFSGYQYFLFTEPYYVSIVCSNSSTYQEVSGHLAIRVACFLRSANLTTFPEKLHHGFNSTNSLPIFPLTSLSNLTLSRITYVTNTIAELTFSNVSEFESVVQDSLPIYLSPYVHFPSIVAPVVLLLLLVIPLFCCVRRALTLYRYLENLENRSSRSE